MFVLLVFLVDFGELGAERPRDHLYRSRRDLQPFWYLQAKCVIINGQYDCPAFLFKQGAETSQQCLNL